MAIIRCFYETVPKVLLLTVYSEIKLHSHVNFFTMATQKKKDSFPLTFSL